MASHVQTGLSPAEDTGAATLRIPCRKCLIAGLREEEVLLRLSDYIDAIDSAKRTPQELYRKRLAACDCCEKLADGMCRECGCFVLYRAAIADNVCPGIPDRWSNLR